MALSELEWLGLFAWSMVVFWQPGLRSRATRATRRRYLESVRKIRRRFGSFFAPPAYLFGVVWYVLYVLMVAAIFLYWSGAENPAGDLPELLNRVMIAIALNLLLNKIWMPVFSGGRPLYVWAFLIALGILASGLWVLVELALQERTGGSFWAFGLWLPYVLWSLYASVLSAMYWAVG